MVQLFKSVKGTHVRRNKFNLSHEVKLTTEFGRLTPFFVRETVPGDKYRLSMDCLVRMAPLYAPIMHRVNLFVHYWYVPCRILQKNFQPFITGAEDGNGTVGANIYHSDPVIANKLFARMKAINSACSGSVKPFEPFEKSSLFDYLGFPAHSDNQDYDIVSTRRVDILPFQAYQMIYNECYRDENFQDRVEIFDDYDGRFGSDIVEALQSLGTTTISEQDEIIADLFRLRQRNWEKDYFTSSLPAPQRGEDTTLGQFDNRIYPFPSDAHHLFDIVNGQADVDAANIARMLELNSSNNISVNELRRALAVQKFKEKLMRFGSRYTEFLRGIFGVRPKDATLQRPQYLGGGRMPIVFGEVLQTSETTQNSALGEYAGRGIGANSTQPITKYCDEHGFIMGILSVMPKPDYCQGWPRMYNRWNKFDYYLPDFANIGEQEVKQEELVFNNDPGFDDWLFGYQSRYAEYKFMPNRVCGDFRESMLDWHMARQFRYHERNMLNADFLKLNNDEMDRIFNFRPSGDYDHLWIQIFNNVDALLPMPKFGTPKL